MKFKRFEQYLRDNKGSSENTILAYERDLRAFSKYLEKKNISCDKATKTDVVEYLIEIRNRGLSVSTENRKLASLRAYYEFASMNGISDSDPTHGIKTPRVERKELIYMTIDEVDSLLNTPDDSVKGIRDKAILEVMYGTGIRVMELIELNERDINIKMGFIECSGNHGKARIVPLGTYAKEALIRYIEESRPAFMNVSGSESSENSPFFLSYLGKRLTRQGLWKILKAYGDVLNINEKLTPHILRTSFAVHMIQNGADLKTLQELLGYDDMQAMEVFMQISKSRIKDVYDKTHPRA